MRRGNCHETTLGEKHLWAISLAATAAVVAASTLWVYWNTHHLNGRHDDEDQPHDEDQAQEQPRGEKSSAKEATRATRSPTFHERVVIINTGDEEPLVAQEPTEDTPCTSQDKTMSTVQSIPEPQQDSNNTRTPHTLQDALNKGIPTTLHIETDQETITDDDNESVATVNWIHTPLRLKTSNLMKKKMKHIGKKLHKISTRRRLAYMKKGITPPPGPIFRYCPESFA